MYKRNAFELRKLPVDEAEKQSLQKNEVYIILDNVLDTYNIGAIFRLADAVAAKKVIICGESETPPNHRIKKASINTTEWIDWEYSRTAVEAIKKLRSEVKGIKVYSVELDDRSVPYTDVDYQLPFALVVGHETTGITEEAMQASDAIVELPMWGINISLNVMVSLGIILYTAMGKAVQKG
jgi:23S rRNA (guanosine2251-2'-O)-methyltransferase